MREHFLKRYTQLFPDFDMAKCSIRDSIRINTLRTDEKSLLSRLRKENVKLEKIPFLRYGYYYEAKFSLGSTPEYLQGFYFLQNASSQIPVHILDPKEKDLVLDMCAAPGAKTSQTAQHMGNKGRIVALDKTKWRLFALRNNLERLGVSNVLIYNKDSRFVSDYKQEYDKILLDAPCTGNFLTDRSWLEKRTMEDVKDRARLQKELLREALKVLKKDGIIVYSTCSIEPEENELLIEWALENFDIKLEKIDFPVGMPGLVDIFGDKHNIELKKCLRIPPGKMQPFFVAKIKLKN